ncbi:MAG: flagellar hook-basal body complex protein FliE [Planctomycetota bacterium]|jgi:flagellar hook-basal body complex protein FliE|nr:flagellar hook-basal body complex protein FliE [Planctomycetota bacterium]
MPIDPMTGKLAPISRTAADSVPARAEPASGAEFKKFFLDNLNKVNTMQQDAGKLVTDMVMGREQDITKVMTAVEKASVAFDTLMAVRNKLVESYQEILRMRV